MSISPAQKSEKLFLSLLTADERQQWERMGCVRIQPKHCRVTTFVLAKDTSQTIEYNGNVKIRGWCTYADLGSIGRLPMYDHYIAKYLALKCNMEHFRERAALSSVY
jgi:hypothetical protein